MKPVLFIDRDGTMVLEPNDYQLDSFEKLEFYPKAFQYLGKIAAILQGFFMCPMFLFEQPVYWLFYTTEGIGCNEPLFLIIKMTSKKKSEFIL